MAWWWVVPLNDSLLLVSTIVALTLLAYTTSFQAINKLIDGPTSLFERGGKEHDRALWAMHEV